MARALKVFRMAIGFHDAYIAAPSRKAALAAWGADRDLFARGLAEEVSDPALTAAPLAEPGVVVKRSRGSAAEQIAALPPDRPERKRRTPAPAASPDRSALDDAEAALAAAERERRRRLRDLNARAKAIERERMAVDREGREEARRLERVRDREAAAYDRAMAAWQGTTGQADRRPGIRVDVQDGSRGRE